jgi:hypothetical protein
MTLFYRTIPDRCVKVARHISPQQLGAFPVFAVRATASVTKGVILSAGDAPFASPQSKEPFCRGELVGADHPSRVATATLS